MRPAISLPYVNIYLPMDHGYKGAPPAPGQVLTATQTDPTLKELDLPFSLLAAPVPVIRQVVTAEAEAAAAAAITNELLPGPDEPYTE